jgi:hypothetical protein
MSVSKKTLEQFIDNLSKKWPSIQNKLSKDGAGHRLFPSRSGKNDENQKLRLDQGPQHSGDEDKFNVNIQANDQGQASHKKLISLTVSKSETLESEDAKKKLTKAAEEGGLL